MGQGSKIIKLTSLQHLGEAHETVKELERILTHPAGFFTAQKGVMYTDRMLAEINCRSDERMPVSIYEDIIRDLIREVDLKCGTGGREAAMIACHLLGEALPMVAAGINGASLRKELDSLAKLAAEAMDEAVMPLEKEKSYRDALISSLTDDAELVSCIASAFDDVGYDGYIKYDVSNGFHSFYEVQEGASFAKGFMTATMATDSMGKEAVLIDPLIVVSERPIVLTGDLLTFMQWSLEQRRPLLLIVEHVEDKPLQIMLLNKTQQNFTSVAVQAPKYGTERKIFMHDIATIVGGSVMCAEAGELGDAVEANDSWQVGGAKKVVVTKDRTTIYGGCGDAGEIKRRLASAERELEAEKDEKKIEFLTDRITLLSGRIGKIFVSGMHAEANAKKKQTEQIVTAVRTASLAGVVAGNGFALSGAASRMKKDNGFLLDAAVRRALEAPARALLEQQGISATAVLEELRKASPHAGYDFKTGRIASRLPDAGSVSPAGAMYMAIAKAFSAAAVIICAEYAVSADELR